MERDRDIGFGKPRPKWIKDLVARGAGSTAWVDRRRCSHDDNLDPIGNCPLGFFNRPFGIGQGDVGRSVDHVLIRKAPVVKQPTIERRESSAQSRRIVAQRLFHANSQSGEEHRSRQALFSHECDASIAIAVSRTNGVKFTEKGAHVAA